MRTIGAVTVARSDYGIYLPLLRKIQADPELRLHLIVSGMHLVPEFGRTVDAIQADGFEIGDRVDMLLASDTPEAIAKSMGLGTLGFAQAYARFRPDILVVLGDRFEMHSAALAALPFRIPIAHLYGGELTHGAIDDSLRHCITKLSHLHFVSIEEYARRVRQLGEEEWRITVAGALSLDNLSSLKLLSGRELEEKYKLRVDESFLLVTFHPVTLEYEQTEWQVNELLAALEGFGMPVILTLPNADTCSRTVIRMVNDFVESHATVQSVVNLGTQGYFSLMALATAMVGNSSSGLIEAPSFGLPVVNIGTRQQGRFRDHNVIDVGYKRSAILEGLEKAVRPEFKERLRNQIKPSGGAQASDAIISRLKNVSLNDELLMKCFSDILPG